MTYLAVNDLVAVAWLKTVLPEMATSGIALRLPDAVNWPEDQFVQVTGVGGSPDPELPQHEPVVEVACWANRPNSAKPPWLQANQLAARIARSCYTRLTAATALLTLGVGYEQARLLERIVLVEPRRVRADASHYARYNVEIELRWVPHVVLTL